MASSSSAQKKSGPRKTARDPCIAVFGQWRFVVYSDKQWSGEVIPLMKPIRASPSIAFIPGRNVIIVAGGRDNCNDDEHLFSSVAKLDLSTMTWSDEPPMATVRGGAAGVCLADGITFIVCGGYNNKTALSSCELFDGKAWAAAADMLVARNFHAMVLYRGQPVVLGGENGIYLHLNMAEQYDYSTNTWSPFPSFAILRSRLSAAVVLDKIYITGGSTYRTLDYVEVFDGNAWSTMPFRLPSGPRDEHAAVCFEDKLVVLGGTRKKVDVFDPNENKWVDDFIPPSFFGDCGAVIF